LTGESRFDTPGDGRVLRRSTAFEDLFGIGRGLEQPWDDLRFEGTDGRRLALEVRQGPVAEDVLVARPPATLLRLPGEPMEGGASFGVDLVQVGEGIDVAAARAARLGRFDFAQGRARDAGLLGGALQS